MSRRHKTKQPEPSVSTAETLDVLHVGVQQTPKKVASSYPKIKLPVAEPAKPDPDKPLDWFDAYERHSLR